MFNHFSGSRESTKLPLIRLSPLRTKNGHKKSRRMSLKLNTKGNMDPTQNPSLGGQ